MSKVIAIMSMSLDGYVADPKDGVAEVFDWYSHSVDVAIHTGGSAHSPLPACWPSSGGRAARGRRGETRLL